MGYWVALVLAAHVVLPASFATQVCDAARTRPTGADVMLQVKSVRTSSIRGSVDEFMTNGTNDTEFNGTRSTCVTRKDPRARSWFTATAQEGTPCVFGVDERDEGAHCIPETEYGSNGWCFTANDSSQWGSCGDGCPLFGPVKALGVKLDNVSQALESLAQEVTSLRAFAMPAMPAHDASPQNLKDLLKKAATMHPDSSTPYANKAPPKVPPPFPAKSPPKSPTFPPKQPQEAAKTVPTSATDMPKMSAEMVAKMAAANAAKAKHLMVSNVASASQDLGAKAPTEPAKELPESLQKKEAEKGTEAAAKTPQKVAAKTAAKHLVKFAKVAPKKPAKQMPKADSKNGTKKQTKDTPTEEETATSEMSPKKKPGPMSMSAKNGHRRKKSKVRRADHHKKHTKAHEKHKSEFVEASKAAATAFDPSDAESQRAEDIAQAITVEQHEANLTADEEADEEAGASLPAGVAADEEDASVDGSDPADSALYAAEQATSAAERARDAAAEAEALEEESQRVSPSNAIFAKLDDIKDQMMKEQAEGRSANSSELQSEVRLQDQQNAQHKERHEQAMNDIEADGDSEIADVVAEVEDGEDGPASASSLGSML
eukprot:gnl/TRDRNA2_/TRDRNA2_38380_c0_seq1.p1 gnl/TRDRNA2_/TRDRNA2_38380_c0~~gnl/TRDRNA2_/TRDRNA2_38380_c0_seq1.p1  ORF type:complete len:601 (-),score=175.25 gnl/TRDRNA2_/TRDRNA2_38380_c0_seq1:32-1834(-)